MTVSGGTRANLSAGFAPIARSDARVLVLGSLPSVRSLRDAEYYAHPQNAFWRIMQELFGASGSYAERCECLRQQRIALWDVLKCSVRPGSMDSDIRVDTAVCNNFTGFLYAHPDISRIAFNGQKAEALFRKFVLPVLKESPQLMSLPSTSPAYASMPFEKKLAVWRRALVASGV